MAGKKKSISETFVDLINPAPLFDAEDDEHPDTIAKVVDNEDSFSEEENSVSTLRKRKFDLLEDGDERYDGKKVSRKSLQLGEDYSDSQVKADQSESENFESGEDEDSDEKEAVNIFDERRVKSDDENEVGCDYSDGEDDKIGTSEDNSSDDDTSNTSMGADSAPEEEDEEVGEESGFQHISNKNSEAEVDKGIAVRNQLNLWNNLLEYRISLQKTLSAANKMPQYNTFQQFSQQGGSTFKSEMRRTKKTVAALLDRLITLQTTLLNSYPETKNLNLSGDSKNITSEEIDEEIPSDTEGEEEDVSGQENENLKNEDIHVKRRSLQDFGKLIEEHHTKYKEYWNSVIQKWNDKTRVSIGKLSNRNFSSFEQSTLKQIEQVLSNRQRLIQRTQLKRSAYNILGQATEQQSDKQMEEFMHGLNANETTNDNDSKEYNNEIFDDTDFYHQLLRELIERKSSDVTDPVQLGRQWLQLQKLRSKMKRKVDTRATKGRKIRYVVHPKLVNFMAPQVHNLWNEDAKTELYNSLFGNRKQ